jgi:hypothetical protein
MIETIPEELHGDMLKEFKTGWNFRKVMAEARAQEVGKVNQLEHRSIGRHWSSANACGC